MNARREVHEDDLTPEQLDEIYGDQISPERQQDGEPVADDEQLDTALVDRQFADAPPAQGEAGGN